MAGAMAHSCSALLEGGNIVVSTVARRTSGQDCRFTNSFLSSNEYTGSAQGVDQSSGSCLLDRSSLWAKPGLKRPQGVSVTKRCSVSCKAVDASTSSPYGIAFQGCPLVERKRFGNPRVPRRDVSVAAKKSRSMREMEDEEEGFQSLVKKMESQERKPPNAPASKQKAPGVVDPYADFAALLDYQDKNDGLLPPSRNPNPNPSPNVPKPVEPVKPRVISRAGTRVASLSGLKVPTPSPARKKGSYDFDFSPYEEPSVTTRGAQSSFSLMGGVTEYKLGDSGSVKVTPQTDFPVRLKGHKTPKKKDWEKDAEARAGIPAEESGPESVASTETVLNPAVNPAVKGASSSLAAVKAGGLGSVNPKVNPKLASDSVTQRKGLEYTLGEDDSDFSVVSETNFPVRTKADRTPKGGYFSEQVGREEPRPLPKKPAKRVPSFQELVSGSAKITDPSIPVVPKAANSEVKPKEGAKSENVDLTSGADISGPRVYTLGEDEGSVSVAPAGSIPVRLKALKVEKVVGGGTKNAETDTRKKVAQRVPGFELPADVRDSGLPKKKKQQNGGKKDGEFRPVAAPKTPPVESPGGKFAAARRFLAGRGLGSGDSGANGAAELKEALTSAEGALTSAKNVLTSEQAEVVKRALSVLEQKAEAEKRGELIVPVVEGKKKVKGKKERAQITAAFPKWKEDYEKVCLDADYALRQLEGLGIEIGREEQNRENVESRSKGGHVSSSEERGKSKGTGKKVDSTQAVVAGLAGSLIAGKVAESRVQKDDVADGAAGPRADDMAGARIGDAARGAARERQTVVRGSTAKVSEADMLMGIGVGGDYEREEERADEPPNWDDDLEDIDLSAYESDSDDEQPEGESKPEFDVKLPPSKSAASKEFREQDAYASFAEMLGDDDESTAEAYSDTETNSDANPDGELSARPSLDEIATAAGMVDSSKRRGADGSMVGLENAVGPASENVPDDAESDSLRASSDQSDGVSDQSDAVSDGSEPDAADREAISNQIFEMLRGTVKGEKREFGTEGPVGDLLGRLGQPPPASALSDGLLAAGKRAEGDRTPEEPVGESSDPIESAIRSVRAALDPVRTTPDASEWSEEVQSAVAKAEAEREMERRRQGPDYGAFDELLREEDGKTSDKAAASSPAAEDVSRSTRPPTLKDQRAPFPRGDRPPKPAVPSRGAPVAATVEARKARWVRIWDVDARAEDYAAAKEWERAEELCPNKEAVEVLVVNYNSGGLQVLFGTLLGFIPSSQLSNARRPPRVPDWMARALTPKDYREVPWGGTNQRESPVGDNRPEAPAVILDNENEEAPREEVDYVNSGIVPETDEQLAIAARQVKAYRTAHLASLVGQRLTVKIVAADKSQRKLIFSERSADRNDGQQEAMNTLLARIKIGDVVVGTVKALMKYGAFVEVDGASCLIHKSELAWVQPKHPGELLQANQQVEAVVIAIDRTVGRVNCSLKRLQPDPLTETLDSLVERAPAEGESIMTEMPELADVIELLKTTSRVGEVRLGRRFRGTAFAPSFQIFLSEKVDNGYRLLARVGVEVQEVLVTTELERDTMKQVVRDATVSNSTERRLALADFAS